MAYKPDARLWTGKLAQAREVYKRVSPKHQRLEEALAGRFPRVVGSRRDETNQEQYIELGVDQVNLNLMLAASQHMLAKAYDEFPLIRYSRSPDVTPRVLRHGERLIEMLMDEGDAVYSCRRAMCYAMTRGPWIVWYGIHGERPSTMSVMAGATSAADVVAAAIEGQPVALIDGMEVEAIAAAARGVLDDPIQGLALTLEQRGALIRLAQEADALHEKALARPHSEPNVRARLWYSCGAYGTDTLWDPTVTDRKRISWAARRIVLTEEEFYADHVFSTRAKNKIKPIRMAGSDGYETVTYTAMSAEENERENGRYVCWEVWDRLHWKRHYVMDGYDGFLEDDDAYPYLDGTGRPVIPKFYPFAVATPVEHNLNVPESTIGVGQLEPGWPMQIEVIKTRSAYLQATKRTARTYVAFGADESSIQAVEDAVDGTTVRPSKGTNSDELKFDLVKGESAPLDYLRASQMEMADFATAVRVSLTAFTGEPSAPTLGQEEMVMQGVTTTQADIIRSYQAGFAELAEGSIALARTYMTDEQIASYLGSAAQKPRVNAQTGQPEMGPDGKPVTDWSEFKATPLDGHKIEVKFASESRREDAVRLKQLMDWIVMLNGLRDGANQPYFDLKSQVEAVAKAMDVEDLRPYEPTASELMMQAVMQMQARAVGGPPSTPGGDRTSPNGGREDGRKAGGERGAPGIPRRQERDREPGGKSQMSGLQQRARTATS